MLDFYRPFQRTQQLRHMLVMVCVGSLSLVCLQRVIHVQQQHQLQQLQQHWQQALNHAMQARPQSRTENRRTHLQPTPPTLLQRLNTVIQQLPPTLWLTELTLQPNRLRLHGGFWLNAPVIELSRRLNTLYPANTHHQLTLVPPDQFHLELRHVGNPKRHSKAASNNRPDTARVYAWLHDEVQQQHFQLIAVRTTGNRTVSLQFNASLVTIQHVLAMLEQQLGAQACSSLTLQPTEQKSLLHASVLCG